MDLADSGRDRDNKVLAKKKRATNVKKKLESRIVSVQKMCIGDINADTGRQRKKENTNKGGEIAPTDF